MRDLLVASAFGAFGLVFAASACSSHSATGGDGGATNLGDADLSTGDGGRKDSLNDAGPCLASNGAAPSCTGACANACQNAVASFRPDVAARIDACLSGRVPATASDSDCQTAAPGCVETAAANACADDNADAFCVSFIASCPDGVDGGSTDQTQSDCVALVQAMSDEGRNALQSCAGAQGSCTTCIASLRALTLASSH